MLTGLDHVVIVVPDLDAAMRRYAALGFTVAPGGRHSTGTHNALIGLAAGHYIELLAFLQPDPQHRWAAALRHGGGLVDVCVSSDDLAQDIARFEAHGIAMEPPRSMSRTKPDGTELHWRLSVPQGRVTGTVPFLIEDVTPIELRRPPRRAHANGVTGIRSIRLATDDLPATQSLLAKVLPESEAGEIGASLAARSARYALGDAWLDAVSPRSPASPLATWLAARGPSLHSMVLTQAGGKDAHWPPADTCGVPIDVVGAD
jgi:catechol 2,3-dioxygenase-like lactoylglutathione lyase family enzyme